MDPLTILLFALVIAGIWAVIELALTLRKARASIDEVAHSANDTIEQLQPVISKVDGAMDDMQPAFKEVEPIMLKAGATLDSTTVTLDSANVTLGHVNGILDDVSSVSSTASSMAESVKGATDSATSGVVGAVGRLIGIEPKRAAKLTTPKDEVAEDEEEDEPVSTGGYVTYVTVPASDEDDE